MSAWLQTLMENPIMPSVMWFTQPTSYPNWSRVRRMSKQGSSIRIWNIYHIGWVNHCRAEFILGNTKNTGIFAFSFYFSTLKWRRQLKTLPWKARTNLYCIDNTMAGIGCWCPGDKKSLVVSSHGIDLVHSEYFRWLPSVLNVRYIHMLCTLLWFVNSLRPNDTYMRQ